MTTMTQQPAHQPVHLTEEILVIRRDTFFEGNAAWQGVKEITDYQAYAALITKHQEYLPRYLMETDASYKQIIPYLIFTHENKLFVMQRAAKASETRLQNKFSLGIGGHIRQEDITNADIIAWAQREFDEEVSYNGTYTIEPIGIINDDTNPVGLVHVGFVYLLHGSSPEISVKEELKSGVLLSYEECEQLKESFEPWSAMIFDILKKKMSH